MLKRAPRCYLSLAKSFSGACHSGTGKLIPRFLVIHTAASSCKYPDILAGCLRECPTLCIWFEQGFHRHERLILFKKKHFISVQTFPLSRSYLKTTALIYEHSSLMTWILLHRGCMTLRLLPACRKKETQIDNQVVTSTYVDRSRIAE